MKKLIFTFLTIFYLGTSSGFAMHLHYCMGVLIDASLVQSTLENCENCGMERSLTDDNDCCSEEFKQLKVDNKKTEENFRLNLLQSMNVGLSASFLELPSFLQLSTSAADYPLVNSPPKGAEVPLYLRNCVFRI